MAPAVMSMIFLSVSCMKERGDETWSDNNSGFQLTDQVVFKAAESFEPVTKAVSACRENVHNGNGKRIAGIKIDSEPMAQTDTKAASVTSLSSFYVLAVTGSTGSEVLSWGSTTFSGSGSYTGGRYWTSSNPGWSFFASNRPLNFQSSGTYISASNDLDVVVAYKTDASYRTTNTLTFSHIFGQIGNITVQPDEGFNSSDITSVSITAVPKTGGTYNIATGTWSGVTTGSTTTIANSTPGTKTNNLMLVPGTYTVSCSWLAKGKAYEGTGQVSVSAGERVNLTITLGGELVIDLSMYDPYNDADLGYRTTANCYIVNNPGEYCLPLFYGNAVSYGSDNLSTAAPAKGSNTNWGTFVNAYNAAIVNGNIKTDLEAWGQSLNLSGGKLIWSTASAQNNALVIVDPVLEVIDGIAYLHFSIPSERFQEGSALIGVLQNETDKLGNPLYVWAWHIWIVNGAFTGGDHLTPHENRSGVTTYFLNRPLGGRGGTSLVNVYYQHGMPFPLPPSEGIAESTSSTSTYSNYAPLYDENGSFTFNRDQGSIITLGSALSKPYTANFANNYNGTQNFINMWDATQTGYSDKEVVKTIYDPSPLGMKVPRKSAFTGFTTNGANTNVSYDYGNNVYSNINVVGSFNHGWIFKYNSSSEGGSFWAASGYRQNVLLNSVGKSGYYWSASLDRFNNALYGGGLQLSLSAVSPFGRTYRYVSASVRPCLEE